MSSRLRPCCRCLVRGAVDPDCTLCGGSNQVTYIEISFDNLGLMVGALGAMNQAFLESEEGQRYQMEMLDELSEGASDE